MSKLDRSGLFHSISVESQTAPQATQISLASQALHANQALHISLPSQAVHIRKNGIEFLAPSPVPEWSELTVGIKVPGTGRQVRANGIVVACHGNRHSGYVISIVFLGLSRQAEERLGVLAASQRA